MNSYWYWYIIEKLRGSMIRKIFDGSSGWIVFAIVIHLLAM